MGQKKRSKCYDEDDEDDDFSCDDVYCDCDDYYEC